VMHSRRRRVLSVHHWTDAVSFTTTRHQGLRFIERSLHDDWTQGEGGKAAAAATAFECEPRGPPRVLSIKVPGGPFTSKLQCIQPGDTIMVGRKPTGTLLIDHLLPGKRL